MSLGLTFEFSFNRIANYKLMALPQFNLGLISFSEFYVLNYQASKASILKPPLNL